MAQFCRGQCQIFFYLLTPSPPPTILCSLHRALLLSAPALIEFSHPNFFFNYTQTFLNKKRRHSSTLPTALSPRCPLLMLSTHSSCCPLSSWPPSRCPQLLPLSSTPPAVLDSSRCPHVVHSSRSTPPVVLWQSLINTFSSFIMSRRHLQYLPP